ncbi:PREDICTED: pollen-specific leucine-rich repeat extensin-like protein 3 isoform X2 [Vollenhovia emeryi]|uniref:pollen-specific leucine-rich repeat extensin-like protein 3 isoform X2 n=1 Tax=Vollenhovia emeryi TaxID=411798 RepID=UPI0005F47BE2|nr:PREDICTED: pollen-specific leucine-rich repeat extensin-like protein 3 isoform X2 [Vollenhovia emeryi]
MHLYSCCALLLLALVACQAAPSSNLIEENSIHEATNSIQLEDAGAEKDRAKKSTTFCVEVRSGKQEQVPCRQEVRPVEIVRQDSKPVVIVPIPSPMPIPAPAPVFPTYVMPPRPQEVKQEVVHQSPVVQPSQPIPAPPSIINIVPPQVPVPCDKQTVVQPQSQHFHTVHVIHPPQTERPVTLVQEARPMKHIKPPVKPMHLPIPHKEIVLPSKPVCQRCNGVIPSHPVNFVVQPSPATVLSVLPHVDACKYQEEGPQCSCQSENSPTSRLGPYPRRYVMPRAMEHPDDATFESMGPFRSPIMSLQSDPRIMSEHPTYFTSEGANREMV